MRATRSLAALPGGSGTPLADGIAAGYAMAEASRKRGQTPVIVALTDGRANVTRDGLGGRAVAVAEALGMAGLVSAYGMDLRLICTAARAHPYSPDPTSPISLRRFPARLSALSAPPDHRLHS